jgi:Ca-activated chloride channel homolog
MVSGQAQENFRIWEDNVEQKVEYFSSEDTPMSIGLIFDATGSMSDMISAARDAAARFLKIGTPEDEYFLVTFSQRAGFFPEFRERVGRHLLQDRSRIKKQVRDGISLDERSERR